MIHANPDPRSLPVDMTQVQELLAALHQAGDCFHMLASAEKGAEHLYSARIQERLRSDGRYSFLGHQGPWRKGEPKPNPGFTYLSGFSCHIRDFVRIQQQNCLQVAATVGSFPRGKLKLEENCVALSAFALDVDPDNFAALVPDSTSPEQVVPEVLRRLNARGLLPHALVHSGRGLHVYLLIDRLSFTSNEERTRAKQAWWQLTQVLGGATDRYDLSSMMRLPGTWNWKGGTPKQAHFIDEHTDLQRPRYSLQDVEAALGDMPQLPAEKAVGARRVSGRGRSGSGGLVSVAELTPDDSMLLNRALELDGVLRKLRDATLDRATGDHSAADWGYGCRLLELGMPKEIVLHELQSGVKGVEEHDPIHYLETTFSKLVEHVWGGESPEDSNSWDVLSGSGSIFYTSINRGDSPPTRGARSAARPRVVLARPGRGKTRDVVDLFARWRWSKRDRFCLMAEFVDELLRHEYVINSCFPFGIVDSAVLPASDSLPRTHEELSELLDADEKRAWPLERIRELVKDPGAFFINTRHPCVVDVRREPEYLVGPSGEEELLPRRSWEPDGPSAVAKFRGRPELCLAGHPKEKFTSGWSPCSICEEVACRANTGRNDVQRGAKTYWGTAPMRLVTQRAFEVQQVLARELNDFDTVVADELPSWVYRNQKVTVTFTQTRHSRAQWEVQPLDTIENFLSGLCAGAEPHPEGGRIREVIERIESSRKKLTQLANKRRKAVGNGDGCSFERMAATREPLLSMADYQLVVGLSRERLPSQVDDEELVMEGGGQSLSDALLGLRDFCSDDKSIEVYFEHGFRPGQKRASLWMYRPMNGWEDLLGNEESRRQVVLLDATAGVDPRYLLQSQFGLEQVPEVRFPNATVVLTSEGTVSKTKLLKKTPQELVDEILRSVGPYMRQFGGANGGGLLVVTVASLEKELRPFVEAAVKEGRLPARTSVAHFGGLRGKNQYRDYDAVYFTHIHRYEESYYVGLQLLLKGFDGVPRQWTSKNAWEEDDALRARAMVSDLYQDALRIGLRQDPESPAWLFVPSSDPLLVIRLMRLFRGAKFIRALPVETS